MVKISAMRANDSYINKQHILKPNSHTLILLLYEVFEPMINCYLKSCLTLRID
jgi:hypothetical protein